MLKKTITYEDYNGQSVTEDFYFSMSKAEIIELEMRSSHEDGFAGELRKIVAEEDKEKILDGFRKFILGSVGRRSEDGKRFIKNAQITEEFEQCPAFSELLVELYTKADAAVEFIIGIVPGDMGKLVKEMEDVQLPDKTGNDPAPAKDDGAQDEPAKYLNQLTPEQIRELPFEEFQAMRARTKSSRLDQRQLVAVFERHGNQ